MALLLTKKQLADELNVSESTVNRLMKGGLPGIKVTEKSVRFNLDDVKKWLDENRSTNKGK